MAGPLRVEVYEPGKKMRVVGADGTLQAPKVLANTYTPRELVDKKAALRAAFRNQLQTMGYQDLDELRAEARQQAQAERDEAQAERDEALRTGIADVCELLGIQLTETRRRRLSRMDASALAKLRQAIKTGRRWPKAA